MEEEHGSAEQTCITSVCQLKWIILNCIICRLNENHICKKKKSSIRETPTLLTDADSGTDTILEKLRDIF